MEIVVHSKKSQFQQSFKRNCTSTGIPNLGVWYKKWSNWTSGVEQKNPTPTPSVVRCPATTGPKTLQLRNPGYDENICLFLWIIGISWRSVAILNTQIEIC